MDETYTYYSGPLEDAGEIESLLTDDEFTKDEFGNFKDHADRTVDLSESGTVVVGIPASDLLDELEQLEFLVSALGLDPDEFQRNV